MDIQLARTFLMVAETGSFIEAGRKMNVTQSTVSARIKTLEDLFGRPLFVRSKNGATLTAAGDQFQSTRSRSCASGSTRSSRWASPVPIAIMSRWAHMRRYGTASY